MVFKVSFGSTQFVAVFDEYSQQQMVAYKYLNQNTL